MYEFSRSAKENEHSGVDFGQSVRVSEIPVAIISHKEIMKINGQEKKKGPARAMRAKSVPKSADGDKPGIMYGRAGECQQWKMSI